MHTFILCIRSNSDINTRLILLRDNFNMLRASSAHCRAVFSDIICAARNLVEIRNGFKHFRINFKHGLSLLSEAAGAFTAKLL